MKLQRYDIGRKSVYMEDGEGRFVMHKDVEKLEQLNAEMLEMFTVLANEHLIFRDNNKRIELLNKIENLLKS